MSFRFLPAPGILQLDPYLPVALPQTPGLIQMALNENCYGPSPAAVSALRSESARVHRYPDPDGSALRKALAEKFAVPENCVIISNGSCGLVELIARAYLTAGDNCITAAETFLVYRTAALATGAACLQVPLRNDDYDLEGIKNAINDRTRLIFIANPNNPTGAMLLRPALETFLKAIPSNILVVLDEAYGEYVPDGQDPGGISLVKQFENVILLKTFSKIYGLAGLRIGYGIACEEVISTLFRLEVVFTTSAPAQAAALAALQDMEYVRESRRRNAEERDYVQRELERLGISFIPSSANFVFMRVGDSRKVQGALLQRGILTAAADWFRIPGSLRVTFGTHEENEGFLRQLSSVGAGL